MLTAQPDGLLFDHRIELELRGIRQLFDKAHLKLIFVSLGFYREVHASQLIAAGFARPEDFQNPALIGQRLGELPLCRAVHQVDRLVNIGFSGAIRAENDIELLQLQGEIANRAVVLDMQSSDHKRTQFCGLNLYKVTVFPAKCKKKDDSEVSSKRGSASGLSGSMGPRV